MKTILLLFIGAMTVRAQCVGIGCSSGGGGGPISTSQLTDFQVTRPTTTSLVGSAGCTASTPCNAPIGGGIPITTGWSAGTPTGAGTIKIYVKTDGSYILGLPASGLNVASCTGCTATVGITQVPADGSAWYIYDWVVSGSAYAATGTDRRLFAAGPWRTNTQGAGITIAQTLADVSYAASGGGGYTPQFRAIAGAIPDGAGCGSLGPNWAIKTTGAIAAPGGFQEDPCGLTMNSTGSTAYFFYYWDGSTVLSAIVRWAVSSGTPAAVEWKGAVSCPTSMNSGGYSTPTAVTTTATTLLQYNYTTILLPMGSCSTAGHITVRITNTAAGSGGTVYTGTPFLIGITI